MELEAFRAIPVIFGHPETFNLGIQLQNSPFSYINDKISKMMTPEDGPKKYIVPISGNVNMPNHVVHIHGYLKQ